MPPSNHSTQQHNCDRDISNYVGRFAPSPSGPLHAGSLLAAVASYVDAKANGGKWLLRIEDVDCHRTVKGAADKIMTTLEQHGLSWDGEVQYQSDKDADYQRALDKLFTDQRLFYCDCTRTVLRQQDGPYPGYCRFNKTAHYRPASRHKPASHAIRFEVGTDTISFHDRILGTQSENLESLGDFILRRRDSLFAYQLAVVVDDARQAVTHVVRGVDLLPSTAWQIALQAALDLPAVTYAHLPLLMQNPIKPNPIRQQSTQQNIPDKSAAVNMLPQKLSKQTGAAAIDNNDAINNLCIALSQLGQPLPPEPHTSSTEQLLIWASQNWQIGNIPTQAINIDHKNTDQSNR